ncbi:MAG: transposase [Sodalis sp. (in: enterobacteria)]
MVVDNFTTHYVDSVREAVKAKNAILLCFPSYLSDLNLIQIAFPELKSLLRKSAARTVHSLWNLMDEAIELIFNKNFYNFL